MLLALDLDGVVCDLGPRVATRLRAHFGIESHPSTWHTYDLSHLGIDDEMLQPFLESTFTDPSLYDGAPLCADADAALAHLVAEGWTIVAVTARGTELVDVTRSWVSASGLPIDDVRHASFLGKAAVAAELGAVASIDDHPREAELLGSVCSSWLFTRPWNAAHVPDRCRRLPSWVGAAGRLRQVMLDRRSRLDRPAPPSPPAAARLPIMS